MSAQTMLAAARASLGLVGRPNYITRDYASRHGDDFLAAAWCDQSITYWARKSGNAAAVLPEGDRAYTVWHAEDGQHLGRWYTGTAANVRAHAKPGAIVFFDWAATDSIGAIDHVGIVERNLGVGRVQTIEANTGDAVKRRVRASTVIAGFWNPDYSKADVRPSEGEVDPADIKKIAEASAAAVKEALSQTVSAPQRVARLGLIKEGTAISPQTAARETWGNTILLGRKLDALTAAVQTLADALAEQNANLDADTLMERINARLESLTIRLDVTDGDSATQPPHPS